MSIMDQAARTSVMTELRKSRSWSRHENTDDIHPLNTDQRDIG
jgi:hypothetical protein